MAQPRGRPGTSGRARDAGRPRRVDDPRATLPLPTGAAGATSPLATRPPVWSDAGGAAGARPAGSDLAARTPPVRPPGYPDTQGKGQVMTSLMVARRTSVLVAALGAALTFAVPARAAFLSFNLQPQTGDGRISYAGGSTALVGKNLGLASINGLDTPSHDKESLVVENGALAFNTGPFTGTTPDGTSVASAAKDWNFGSGGSVTLTGGIPALGIPAGSNLLSGTFSDPSTVRPLGGNDLKVQGAAVLSDVNKQLAQYFGLQTGVMYTGGISTLFSAAGNAPSGFSSTGYTAGQVTTTPVPEPGTLALFALTLGCVAALRRRAA